MIKHKNIILFFTILLLFLLPTQFIFALELNYPSLPNFGALGDSPLLADYIQYFFILAISIAAGIGIISIVISGLQILLSAGSPSAVGAARERIRSAILGIILLMFAVVILRTINQELVNLRTTFLQVQSGVGVYYRGYVGIDAQHPDGFEYQPAPQKEADTSLIPTKFTQLFYSCSSYGGPDVLVWRYNMPNFNFDRNSNGAPYATTVSLPCSGNIPINNTNTIDIKPPVASLEWEYNKPGIYFYILPNCGGISSAVNQTDGNVLTSFDSQPIADSVQSIKIVNDSSGASKFSYQVILNNSQDFGEECGNPITAPAGSYSCISKSDSSWPKIMNWDTLQETEPISALSFKLIKQNIFYPENKGVTFWSNNLQYSIEATSINSGIVINKNLDTSLREGNLQWHEPKLNQCSKSPPGDSDYDKSDTLICMPQDECAHADPDCTTADCPKDDFTFQDRGYHSCLDYETSDGRYATVIYTENQSDQARICQIFELNGLNEIQFKTEMPIFGHSQTIYRAAIIPQVP